MNQTTRMSRSNVLVPRTALILAAGILSLPICGFSQVLSTNNSYATMLQNNSIMQSNLTNQMINLGGKPTSGSGAPVCFPPLDLQRGPAGLVPPALQGDPRYQEYLHCRYGNVPITPAMANAPALPVHPAAGSNATAPSGYPQAATAAPPVTAPSSPSQHLPISATDFVPAQVGHPVVDQELAKLSIGPNDRVTIVNMFNVASQDAAQRFRANNMAVAICVAYQNTMYTLNGQQADANTMYQRILSVNDAIARGPRLAAMSDQEKQNFADTWIYESAVLTLLRASGQSGNRQAAQQATQLAQVLLQRLNSL